MNKGILYAVGAYVLWGVLPIYFKAMVNVPSTQILAHRIVWSSVVLTIVILLRREFALLRNLANRRVLLVYSGAGVLLAANWVYTSGQ